MPDQLVSIIIPAYNWEKYIAASINSALAQTWPQIEIIVVDDGSTDNTLNVARSFEAKGVKVIHQVNQGASAARNRGLKEAKGQYIQFLDADDLLAPDKIQAQMQYLQQRQDAVCICPVVYFNDHDQDLNLLTQDEYSLAFYRQASQPFEFLLKLYGAHNNRGAMVLPHSWLTPKTIIDRAGFWDETLTVNDDGEFFCRVALQAEKIFLAESTVCYYRKHKDNASLSARKDVESNKSLYRSILLIRDHLQNFKQDDRIKLVTNRSLMGLLVFTYPQQKGLSREIANIINQSGVPAIAPPIGGRILELIKKIFGWKTARLLQYYKQRILGK
ncbi:glycosyltransferase family 2 protein [Mucilaginibacter litoreus]|uniref:Glycosyltransferase family 2 protein n=1 Tax=Mucilaginibacter litoreus TaxID=1048221 RepID=A0ABW3AVX9_9SPHI